MSHESLRILLIGAHPDDCEGLGGGYATLMTRLGHAVKMLSMTDGSLGHYAEPKQELIPRRRLEAQAAADIIGAQSQVLANPDGELTTDLPTREGLVHTIREYAPDLIITHRPFDYHPDHRNTSILVQDASYLLCVPGYCPGTPALRDMPHIMFFQDHFKQPPFEPDVVISIDEVMDTKYRMMAAHASQYFEWLAWMDHRLDEVPTTSEARLEWLRSPRLTDPVPDQAQPGYQRGEQGQALRADRYRKELIDRYGESATALNFVEAYQCCEYGASFTEGDLARYFPATI